MNRFNLSEWAIRHRSVVTYFMLVIMVAGVWSYLRLGRSEDPDFTVKTMVVQANWPGATKAVAENFPPKERGFAVAFFDSGSAVGGAIAPAFIVWLYHLFGGWRPAFVITGLYVRFANKELDPRAEAIRSKLENEAS